MWDDIWVFNDWGEILFQFKADYFLDGPVINSPTDQCQKFKSSRPLPLKDS